VGRERPDISRYPAVGPYASYKESWKMTKRNRIVAGDVSAIPLPHGGFAAAVVCAINRRRELAVLRVYGPRAPAVDALPQPGALAPADAIAVRRASSLRMDSGDWPVIGRIEPFNLNQWRAVAFLRPEPGRRNLVVVEYDPKDPVRVVRERAATAADSGLPSDGAAGWRSLQYELDELLLELERTDPERWGEPWR
jgi:hypothetical protein